MNKDKHGMMTVNRILLGLVMLVPGLLKLFVKGPDAITGMMAGIALFAWAPAFWAWVLILAEIFAGIMIITRWNIKTGVIFASIILLVAAFTMHLGDYGRILMHLALISNYLLWGCKHKHLK